MVVGEHPLPVRPVPRSGEGLSAFAVRLAEANGMHWRHLVTHRRDVDVPLARLRELASAAGLETHTALALTLDRYPLTIRGHGLTRRRGWRLQSSVSWVCPSCTPSAGQSDLLWQTALMPACLRCGCYLVRDTFPLDAREAAPDVLELVARLADLAEASVTDLGVRRRLTRLRGRCVTVANTIDDSEPPRPGHLPAVDVPAARSWGVYPSADPPTVATILVIAGGGMLRRHNRVDEDARVGATTYSAADRNRLQWFQTRIDRYLRCDGLALRHVPSMLPRSADEQHPPGPGAWLSRARAAAALYLLIGRASDPGASPSSAMTALGLPGATTALLIHAIDLRRGLRDRDAQVLGDGLDLLLDGGLVDYQRRREVLRGIAHLPRTTARRLSLQDGHLHTAEQLALSWIWMRFTHGPMHSSRWPHIPDRDVHKFGTGLDPETRLLLHETGQQLLADADLTAIPLRHATRPAVTSR